MSSDATVTFVLPAVVANAIKIGSCARYPSAPADAVGRWGLEASRHRRLPEVHVTCKARVAQLVLKDVAAASKCVDSAYDQAAFLATMDAIRGALP